MVTPAARREAVVHLGQGYGMSERRACSLIGADRSSVRYRHQRPDDRELREVLRGAAETYRRFGYRRLHVILRRDGHVLNRKRTQRLSREEGLSVRHRRSRKRAIGTRPPLVTQAMANARWSIGFVHDQFADGRRFRILNVIASLRWPAPDPHSEGRAALCLLPEGANLTPNSLPSCIAQHGNAANCCASSSDSKFSAEARV
jgi:putative transposase